MALKLDLSEEVLFRLRAEAERRQLSMRDLVEEMLGSLLLEASPPSTQAKRKLSFIAIGSSVSGRRASEADEMLSEGFGTD